MTLRCLGRFIFPPVHCMVAAFSIVPRAHSFKLPHLHVLWPGSLIINTVVVHRRGSRGGGGGGGGGS